MQYVGSRDAVVPPAGASAHRFHHRHSSRVDAHRSIADHWEAGQMTVLCGRGSRKERLSGRPAVKMMGEASPQHRLQSRSIPTLTFQRGNLPCLPTME